MALGVDVACVAMTVAWGDAWTSPIHAVLGAACACDRGLQAKDVVGYCAMQLLLTGIIIAIGLSFL
jgi:short-chain fatty acids transporter